MLAFVVPLSMKPNHGIGMLIIGKWLFLGKYVARLQAVDNAAGDKVERAFVLQLLNLGADSNREVSMPFQSRKSSIV